MLDRSHDDNTKEAISSTEAGPPVKKSQTSSFTETGSIVAKGREEPGERNLGEFFPIDFF